MLPSEGSYNAVLPSHNAVLPSEGLCYHQRGCVTIRGAVLPSEGSYNAALPSEGPSPMVHLDS